MDQKGLQQICIEGGIAQRRRARFMDQKDLKQTFMDEGIAQRRGGAELGLNVTRCCTIENIRSAALWLSATAPLLRNLFPL
jgi:hypothetical protein